MFTQNSISSERRRARGVWRGRPFLDTSSTLPRHFLEAFGADVLSDTCFCMAEALIPPGAQNAITNSAKLAHYGVGLYDVAFRLARMSDCVEAAVTARAPEEPPRWLRVAR